MTTLATIRHPIEPLPLLQNPVSRLFLQRKTCLCQEMCIRDSSGTIIGLDRQYALELVRGSEVLVEYDKLIDRQLERAAITSISGFGKIMPEASKVLVIG